MKVTEVLTTSAGAAAIRQLIAERDRLREALERTSHDVEQTLGRTLGYPRYADDQEIFPGATDADGVCVGDHVPGSLAAEAAGLITALRAERDELRAAVRHALVVMDRLLPTMDPSADDDEVEEAIECRC